jgi:hypothetical protein
MTYCDLALLGLVSDLRHHLTVLRFEGRHDEAPDSADTGSGYGTSTSRYLSSVPCRMVRMRKDD